LLHTQHFSSSAISESESDAESSDKIGIDLPALDNPDVDGLGSGIT
jgi:hypothetical protein